jgi:4-amino-4-deoxy-L-arabinose transferase-like glycosyltransferase
MMITHKNNSHKVYLYYIIASIIIYIVGSIFIPLMEVDAVQYANISREMLQNQSFLQIFDQGKDYLDKPPLLFWMSSLSMYIFGINDFAYRLPSILMAIIAIYSTYKFTLLYYVKEIAILASLVLATSQAMFLITHDVRTDTMLMGWVILGIWQFSSWLQNKNWISFITAFVAIAFGMMTKGPIALMVPIFSFAPHFIVHKNFKLFFRWEYLIGLVIILILLIPMDIGLYRQFDLHPEKIMYDKTGTSGLRFFYWTQSFGRITGESVWHENDSIFFLFQNFLWGFLPWILFFIMGLFLEVFDTIRNRFSIGKSEEWISLPGFIITYFALGISNYQLPHYIYIVLPFAAIITAKYIYSFNLKRGNNIIKNGINIVNFIAYSIILLLLVVLLFIPFETNKFAIISALLFVIISFFAILFFYHGQIPKMIHFALLTILTTNLLLGVFFYPKLLEYQLGNKVTSFVNEQKINKRNFYLYKINTERSMDFYSNHSYQNIDEINKLKSKDYVLVTRENMNDSLLMKFNKIELLSTFHVSTLTGEFLNPLTRDSTLNYHYILQKK